MTGKMCDFVFWPILRSVSELCISGYAQYDHRGNRLLREPKGIAVHPITGEIYIADTAHHRICVVNKDLDFVRAFGKHGNGAGEFICPSSLSFSSDGAVLAITEDYSHRVQLFDGFDRHIRAIGNGKSTLPGRFSSPASVTFDLDDNFYVAEIDNARIQKFSKTGAFLGFIGIESVSAPVGNVCGVVVNDDNEILALPAMGGTIRVFGADGIYRREMIVEKTGKFNFISRGPHGGFVMSSVRHDRVWIYNKSGILKKELVAEGPNGVCFDRDGTLFVVSLTTSQLAKF
eukprot:TRINITY_DN9478_c0_g1_i2.p1 TRINITY_DN9478_c0_g1~~TRINITY_DN9478_c0_g1_i2.p1  ORF type:complete len:288 (-),score=52.63 TRINITY_DN9478_c0_g1_i2:79-942(-)